MSLHYQTNGKIMHQYQSYEQQHVEFVTSENGTSIIEILLILYSMTLLPLLASLLLPWIVPSTFNQYTKCAPRLVVVTRIIVEYGIVMLLPVFIITIFTGGTFESNGHEFLDNPGRRTDDKEEYEVDENVDTLNTIIFTPCVAVALTFICVSILVVNYSITQPIWLGISKHWNKIKDRELQWSKYFTLEEDGQDDYSSNKDKDGQIQMTGTTASMKLPFITNYRALVTYITVLSIIAVDFPIFPRRFCKTKLYGFSLMDIGTGSFIFANGIVSSEAKRMKSNLGKSIKTSIPLLILGLIRLLTIKGVEYHEVVEEYGLHWNFFFTLATVKIFTAVVFTFVPPSFSLKACVTLSCLYEVLLVYFDYQSSYILNSTIPRETSLIAANREGIFSTLGYTAIYLGSVHVGQIIYNSKLERRTLQNWCAYSCQTLVQIIILWILTYTSITFGNSSCRRLANLSYIMWILTTNYTVMWLCLVTHLFQIIVQYLGLLHGPLVYHELFGRKNAENKTETAPFSSAFQSFVDKKSSKNEVGDDLPDDNVLESIDRQLNKIQEKLKHHKESINTTAEEEEANSEDSSVDAEELKAFARQIESEFENVSERFKSELQKTVKQQIEEEKKQIEPDFIQLPDLTRSPITLEAICYNGLFVFLIGNLLTGFINLSVHTIYVPITIAIFILWSYATLIVLISTTLYWYQIQLKIW